MRLVLKAKRMPIGTISRGRKKIAESRWVNIAAEGSGFSRDMIQRLRKEWGKLTTANPDSPIYKKLEALIGTLDVSRLRQLASANIKFVSLLAKIQMSKLKRKMTVGGGTSYARPILQPVFKSKYTRRWKGKDGQWHYEYGKPRGGKMAKLPDGSGAFVATIGTTRSKKSKVVKGKEPWRDKPVKSKVFSNVASAGFNTSPKMHGHYMARKVVWESEQKLGKHMSDPKKKALIQATLPVESTDWHTFAMSLSGKEVSLVAHVARYLNRKSPVELLTYVEDRQGMVKTDLLRLLEYAAYKKNKKEYVESASKMYLGYGIKEQEARERTISYVDRLKAKYHGAYLKVWGK